MVEQIQAFKAADGKVFDNLFDAEKHDCRCQLNKIIGNDALVNTIMASAEAVHKALDSYVAAHQARPKVKRENDRVSS